MGLFIEQTPHTIKTFEDSGKWKTPTVLLFVKSHGSSHYNEYQ